MIDFSNVNKSLVFKLMLVHVALIGLANYVVQFPARIFDIKITLAMFLFPLILVATDLTIRLTNKQTARLVIGFSFIPAIIVSGLVSNWRIGVASACAYLIGQLLDVTVFQKIRERFEAWWSAPLASSIVSNIVDTYVFFAAAFIGSANAYMAANWLAIANADVVFKVLVSTLVVLPVYGYILNRLLKKIEEAKLV